MKKGRVVPVIVLAIGFVLSGCSDHKFVSFSLGAVEDQFTQQGVQKQSGEFDILWVIDNSGSMASSQNNLAANMDSFIAKFQDRQLDFRMAVITTDAYRDKVDGKPHKSLFRDGNEKNGPTGWPVISSDTPNLRETFLKNVLQGAEGNGDERPFASIVSALENPTNAGFIRPDALLAVIILSDEDDFSHDGNDINWGDYNDPDLHPVARYKEYLEALKPAGPGGMQRYTVSSISAKTQTCVDKLKDQLSQSQRVGKRIMELVDSVGGVNGDICGDFSETLSLVSKEIIELGTQFRLSGLPDPQTIKVLVNNAVVPQDAENGWTFNEVANSIIFHGTAVPPNGANIRVEYVPTRPN